MKSVYGKQDQSSVLARFQIFKEVCVKLVLRHVRFNLQA